MTFNTGNNVPSTDPRDLYDNAENLDKLVNGADPFYADRKGKLRQSWAGMENDFDTSQEGRETAFTLSQADKESRFQAFLVSSGYVSKGDYAANVVLTERNEYVFVSAETTGATAGLYFPAGVAAVPLTLTGDWATDLPSLTLREEDVLRQELGSSYGAGLVKYALDAIGSIPRSLQERAGETITPFDFGAAGVGGNDTEAVQKAVNDAINKGLTVDLAGGIFGVEGLNIAGDVIFAGPGEILHNGGSSTPAIKSTGGYRVSFEGATLNGNKSAQTSRLDFCEFSGSALLRLIGCRIKDTVRTGVRATGTLGFVHIEDCDFEGMAPHGGALGQTSCAAEVVAVSCSQWRVINNRVTAPVYSQGPAYQPGGFFTSTSSGCSVMCFGNYFENIGQRQSANFIGSIDLYTRGHSSIVAFNKSKNASYVPWKLQNSEMVIAIGNEVIGLSDTGAGAGMVVSNVRDYTAQVGRYVLQANVFRFGLGANNLPGIGISGSAAHFIDSVSSANNIFVDTGLAYSLSRFKDVVITDDICDASTAATFAAIDVSNTDTAAGTGAPALSSLRIRGFESKNPAYATLFARTNVTNLRIDIDGQHFAGSPSAYHATVRNAKSLSVLGGIVDGAGGSGSVDAQSLDFVQLAGIQGSCNVAPAISGVGRYIRERNTWDLAASAAWAPSAIPTGGILTTDISVAGVGGTMGLVEAEFSGRLSGLILTAWVLNTGVVRAQLYNPTGASVTPPSGTLSVTVKR